MRWMIPMLVSSVLIACSDAPTRLPVPYGSGGSGDGATGTGGAAASGPGGGGGAGEGGGGGSEGELVTMSIAPAGVCTPHGVAPGPDELGGIALGRFEAQAPFLVKEFRYVACSGMAHEVVYFRSASEVPDEEPAELWSMAVLAAAGEERQVTVPLDPPLRLTDDQRFGYFGVRMTGEGTSTMCVVACADSDQPDRNHWSDNDAPPFGWKQLSQSPTPDAGLPYDYQFSIAGQPF
ncbi:uncharacterized protein SOCE26_040790 [Sorangium cellulosum]|uniref:Uncharacterized protein n=1 Tax=Sorangium cellulosum TaxID=56 RepID=A0A2L0ETM0_SORCE|nr:hypothetical protein [Sorangium cellulosum]AUX42646.1 uncharacterized protein SOCE26_040790 [Sorangium cellulosum]